MTDKPAGTLNEALAELQTQLPHISKSETAKVPTKAGGSYQYTYADLADVSREVLPLLGKLGLSFTSRPTLADGRLVLVYELRHISGEQIDGVYPLPGSGTPQEIGGAITYARRYCLCAVTGVAPDNDDNDAVAAEKAAVRRERQGTRQQRDAPAAPQESPITGEQQREMQTLFRDAGVAERDAKVKYATAVVKRPLNSATELTQDEAGRVIQSLRRGAERRAEKAQPEAQTTLPVDPEKDPEGWLASQEPPAGGAQ